MKINCPAVHCPWRKGGVCIRPGCPHGKAVADGKTEKPEPG